MSKRFAAVKAAVSAVALVGMVLFTGCVVDPDDPDNPDKPNTGGGGGSTTAGTQANPIVFTGNGGSGTYALTSAVQTGWFKFTADGRYTLTVRDRGYSSASTSPYTSNVTVTVLDATLDNYVKSINNTMMNGVNMGSNDYYAVTLTDLSGVCYVKIDPYQANYYDTGTFYIALEKTGPVTVGAGQADAIDITNYSPVPYELELTSSKPARWFKFTADGRYILTVRDRNYSSASTSPYTSNVTVTVLDSTLGYVKSINNTVMNGVNMGSNDYDAVTLTDLSGVCYVKIGPYQTNYYDIGTFYVALEKTGPVTAGIGQVDAIPLIIGANRVRDELTSSRPSRWFTFTAPADGSVGLTVYDNSYTPSGLTEEKPTANVVVTVLDASLQFVSNSGGTVMNRVNIGATNQSPVTFNSLTPGGVYYVKIDPYQVNYSDTGLFYIGVN